MNTQSRSTQRIPRWLPVVIVAMAILTACGDSENAPVDGTGEGAGTTSPADGASDGEKAATLVQAPDPAWDWITDQGIRQEMEETAGIHILDSNTWDYFGVYAGGHADVVQVSSYGLSLLEEETGIPTTVFGKYNTDRTMIMVRTESEFQDLCEMEGETIAVNTPVSTTIIWGAYVKELCDLDFRVGSGDYDLVLTDAQSLAPLVASGDAAACICLPDFAIRELMNEELRNLYEGTSTEFFHNMFLDGQSYDGPQNNLIVAPTAWLEANPDEAKLVLALWDTALKEWSANSRAMVETYPQHFAASNKAEQDFIIEWMQNEFDWYSDTAYLSEEFVENERKVYDLLKRTGFMDEDATVTFEVIPPPT